MSRSLDTSIYYTERKPTDAAASSTGLTVLDCCQTTAATTTATTAEMDEAAAEQARGSMRRLAVALGLAMVLAFLCFVLAPRYGVYLPMIVPLMGFAAIAVGTVVAAAESQARRPAPAKAPGRPMCCGGPRPVGERMRMLSEKQ